MIAILLAAGLSCGVERAEVKHLTDPDANKVNLHTVWERTITQLVAAPIYLPVRGEEGRGVGKEEWELIETIGIVVVAKHEADSDFHIGIAEPGDHTKTMIAESVDPDCVSEDSRAHDAIMLAREAILEAIGGKPSNLRQLIGKRVKIRGVGFFDVLHGQSAVAPNGIELHPITFFRVLD